MTDHKSHIYIYIYGSRATSSSPVQECSLILPQRFDMLHQLKPLCTRGIYSIPSLFVSPTSSWLDSPLCVVGVDCDTSIETWLLWSCFVLEGALVQTCGPALYFSCIGRPAGCLTLHGCLALPVLGVLDRLDWCLGLKSGLSYGVSVGKWTPPKGLGLGLCPWPNSNNTKHIERFVCHIYIHTYI